MYSVHATVEFMMSFYFWSGGFLRTIGEVPKEARAIVLHTSRLFLKIVLKVLNNSAVWASSLFFLKYAPTFGCMYMYASNSTAVDKT